MQSAIQIAYFKTFGEFVATYESASTCAFKLGRTEVIIDKFIFFLFYLIFKKLSIWSYKTSNVSFKNLENYFGYCKFEFCN